ncbi:MULTISPECIES: hypothetical protein [unclassified Lysobacter]|uniref:hypothetical protein n=1 Tax=unclassified Lysobacter TaxID=2635362 RepID=UPI001C21AB6D|nr:hypothetical protein [Lysobacter sp. MMG2]MBU8977228.1 hypothetical protein [Lysobacter sp. MMG2]
MMIRTRLHTAVAAALLASVALVGCKKKEEPVAVSTPPATTEPAAPAPAPAPAATVSVTTVDLGPAVGPDKKITTPSATFKPKDTINASVGTATSDPATAVAAKLGAKWTFQDGQTVKEDSADINFAGGGNTVFSINSPKGFPTGKYKLEVLLDGVVVQTRDFEVK